MSQQQQIEDYFEKSFEFIGNKSWYLPPEAYKAPPWHIDTLQQMKVELNNVKGQLSNFNLEKWSKHTRFRDPSSSIISTLKTKGSIELLTQAWCKFYECLSRYTVVPDIALCNQALTSLHLCEAPGAFVSALNRFLYTHHRRLEWNWLANTLNPYYEGNPTSDMIADDRLIRHTLEHWDFGIDLTGDLMKYYNHEEFVQKGPVMLVTADGSVDCMNDPGEQENNVHFLHYCETLTALRVLEKWGTFVLKLFTMFEHGTICLMYLLNCCFTKVHVFKPCSSKSGNSEVYVICLGFKGWTLVEHLWPSLIAPYQGHIQIADSAMFSLNEINPEFLQQLEKCAKFFMDLQSYMINENVLHFIGEAKKEEEEINQLKTSVAEHFIKKYRLAFHVPKRHKLIVSYERREKYCESNWDFKEMLITDFPECSGCFLDVKIGRAIMTVTTSNFCQEKFVLSPYIVINNNELEDAIRPFVSSHCKKISHEQFCDLPQYKFQKQFFCIIKGAAEKLTDIVIIAIPLLTRFLVGLIYILALGYENVLVYKKGVLVFHNLREDKLPLVQKYLRMIDVAYYRADYETRFVADILEIIPETTFDCGNFYEIICRYNNGIFKQQE